jgi:hypothetical protein
MMNTYVEFLEQIIAEMKVALSGGNAEVIESDYCQWLDFLRQVHPDSSLLKNAGGQPKAISPGAGDDQPDSGLKAYSDLREIIRLAAAYNYPAWYIQPHFIGLITEFVYEKGELQNALAIQGVPKIIERFSGKIKGVWLDEQTFIAGNTDTKTSFTEKMEFLKQAGFIIPDFVLFPTDKLLTISVRKLEISLMNFISTARAARAQVDGAMIVSDTPLFGGDNGANPNRIIYKPLNLSLTL